MAWTINADVYEGDKGLVLTSLNDAKNMLTSLIQAAENRKDNKMIGKYETYMQDLIGLINTIDDDKEIK